MAGSVVVLGEIMPDLSGTGTLAYPRNMPYVNIRTRVCLPEHEDECKGYVHEPKFAFACMHACMHTCSRALVTKTHTHTCMCVCACVCVHVHVCVCVCVCFQV